MEVQRSTPISEVAAFVPGAIGLFETLGVDYSCAGHLSLADACRAEGLDPDMVVRYVRMLDGRSGGEPWGDKPASAIVTALAEMHRKIRDELKRIALALAESSAEVHELRVELERVAAEIVPHLDEEENEIFASVEAIEHGSPPKEEVRLQLRRLVVAHGVLASRLRRLRSLRLSMGAVEQPPDVSRELHAIAELEGHIHEVMFVENCILFPRALAMDEAMHVAV